ncbi:MAG: hypothetical protein R3F46_15845 [bacterium]
MKRAGRIWTLVGALAWLGYFALTVSLPSVEFLPEQLSLALQGLSIILGMSLLFMVILVGESADWPAWSRYLMFAGGVGSILLPVLLADNSLPLRAFSTLGLILISLPVGYWVGDRMEKVTNLVPLAVAMAFADIFSVFQGPSKRIVEGMQEHQQQVAEAMAEAAKSVPPEQAASAAAAAAEAVRVPWINYLFVHLPLPIGDAAPVMGVGDFVILAFLFRAAWVHGLNRRVMFWSTLAMAIIALAASLIFSLALPALVSIAFGTLIVLWFTEPRMRAIDRQEILLSFAVAGLFMALMAAKWFTAAARVQ